MACMFCSMKSLVLMIHAQMSSMRWRRRPNAFTKENGYNFDIVLVMPIYEASEKLKKKEQMK